jgi:hypothetical protein
VKPRWSEYWSPFSQPGDASPGLTRFARLGLDLLVVFNVVAQALTVVVLLMGRMGAEAAPVAGGATVALFLLMYFYARWMFPFLKARHILVVLLFKEAGVILLVGFAVAVVALIRWVF